MKNNKEFKSVLSIVLVLSVILGNFSLSVFAYDKEGVNLEKNNFGKLFNGQDKLVNKNSVDVDNIKSLPVNKINKENLSEPKKKLGTDLLRLIDDSFLLPNQKRTQVISQMKELKQFIAKENSVKTLNREITNKAHNDLVYVYVKLDSSTSSSIIDSIAWEVTDRDEKNHLAVALVEVDKLETLASMNGVKNVRSVLPPVVHSGSVVTEGDMIHQTDDVRDAYSQKGAGIKIGVISDGVDNIASAQSTGDLPAIVTVLSNTNPLGAIVNDEGTAMLEIIHDMVPDAQLYFHDCGNNVIAFNSAIDSLVAEGVNVIVDDIGWRLEPFFEDGTIALHVADVLADNNIVYVSSAGNSGSSGYYDGHYQGDYYSDGSPFHDFSRGSEDIYKYLYLNIPNNGEVIVILQWNDEFGLSDNNYDLYLYKYPDYGSPLSGSAVVQDGNDDPLEGFSYTNTTGNTIIAEIDVLKNGSATNKTLEVFIYPKNGTTVLTDNITPVDSIFGHAAVPGVIAVGAIAADDPDNDTIESFSSQGPVTINGQSQRVKPDVAGIDKVSVTGAGGFPSPFSGTSAAAPHIAAIVAQLWGQYPLANGDQIRDQILNSAEDLGTAGTDNIFGHGRANSLLSFQTGPTINSFSFANPSTTGVIDESTKTIAIEVPFGTNVTALTPTIGITGATVSPISGVAQDFTSSVTYTVTVASGLVQTYTVTVTVASDSEAPTLTIGSQSASNGATIHIPINASYFSEYASNIGSVTLNIQYDETLLTYVTTTINNLPVTAQANQSATNIITINWSDATAVTPITIPDGALVTLDFTVISSAITSTGLSLVGTNEVTDGAFDLISTTFLNGSISLNPPAHTISGTIKYYDGVKVIPNATVILEDDNSTELATTTTDANGVYQFMGVDSGGDYVVRVDKDDDASGLSGADQGKIGRHIVGFELFDSIYKIISGDVNDSGGLSGADQGKIGRFIVGLDSNLPSGAWKFYSSDATLTVLNYLTEGLARAYINLTDDLSSQDFVGIKMGDVNNSWSN